jgi:hypothetical protein
MEDNIIVSKDHKNIKQLLNDFNCHPEIMISNIKNFFVEKPNYNKMNQKDVGYGFLSLIDNISSYRDDVKITFTICKKIIKKKKKMVAFESPSRKHNFYYKKMKLKIPFVPLIIKIIPDISKTIFYNYKTMSNYKFYHYTNNIRIWYKPYDINKKQPIIFYSYFMNFYNINNQLLELLEKKYNLIIPELITPSHYTIQNLPNSISDINETIYDFLTNKYDLNVVYDEKNILRNSDLKVVLLGNGGISNNICCNMINKYPNIITNYFCINGQILPHKFLDYYLNLSNEITKHKNIGFFNQEQLLIYEYLHKKCLSIITDTLYESHDVKIYTYTTLKHSKQFKYSNIKKDKFKYFETTYINVDNDEYLFEQEKFRKCLLQDIEYIYH